MNSEGTGGREAVLERAQQDERHAHFWTAIFYAADYALLLGRDLQALDALIAVVTANGGTAVKAKDELGLLWVPRSAPTDDPDDCGILVPIPREEPSVVPRQRTSDGYRRGGDRPVGTR